MLDEKYRRANCYGLAKSDSGLWVYDYRVNALFWCDTDSNSASMYVGLSEDKMAAGQYNQILQVGDEIIFVPNEAEDIAIIHKNSGSIKHINISEKIDIDFSKEKLRLLNFIVDSNRYVYLAGYNCPMIIKLDINDESICDVIEFSKAIDMKSDKRENFNGYVGWGGAVFEDRIFFPILQDSVLIEYIKDSNDYKCHRIESNNTGYSSLLRVDSHVWVQDCNANRIIVLNDNLKIESIIRFGDESTEISNNFCLIDGKENVYIVPKSGKERKAYYVKKSSYTVHDWEKINEALMLDDSDDMIQSYPVIRINCKEDIVYFITGHDLKYHEYNTSLDTMIDKYIYLPEDIMERYYCSYIKNSKEKMFCEKNEPLRCFLEAIK